MPTTFVDTRLTELSLWAAKQLELTEIELTPLGGDAGFRRYFRFASPSRYLVVDAPPSTEDTPQFLRVAELLAEFHVKTPRIFATDKIQGFLLVEDLGDALMYQKINSQNADDLYQQANDLIIRMQQIQPKPDWLPTYDLDFLLREMNLFSEWFVEKLLGYKLTDSETQLLANSFTKITASAANQPQVFVHRDFHSRNLLINENHLATIDFQGALWGPITYDLVSLLRDCYLRWPQEKVQHWALDFYHKQQSTSTAQFSSETFLKWFDWMGLQRHIKVLGIFARLHLRDNKHHYLQDLPLVIRHTLEVSSNYRELKAFVDWFKYSLLPLAEKKDWYSDYKTAGELE
jgi:N-acetylmuramate 1-kinase